MEKEQTLNEEFEGKVTIIAYSVHAEIYEYVMMRLGAFLLVILALEKEGMTNYPILSKEEAEHLKVSKVDDFEPTAGYHCYSLNDRMKELYNRAYDLAKEKWPTEESDEWWNEVKDFVPHLWN